MKNKTDSNWISRAAIAVFLAASFPLASVPLLAQGGIPTQAVVTVMPKSGTEAPPVTQQELQVTVNKQHSQISEWTPLRGERSGLQLMILIDGTARGSLSLQYDDLKRFIQQLPDGAQVGLAYMQNGSAVVAQNLTADHKLAADALRITSGPAGSSGSPYFCLSDLVKKWPNGNTAERREVLMITDGVDLYNGRGYDPNDPYVDAAIKDAQRAGVLVHSIFYKNIGGFDNRAGIEFGGQSYLLQVADATGGRAYYLGTGNPVSFVPFLDDLHTRLMNQYELGLLAKPGNKTELQNLKIKTTAPNVKIEAPQAVLVQGSEAASR
jgi:hypothetical protein